MSSSGVSVFLRVRIEIECDQLEGLTDKISAIMSFELA